jgi:hypothetical protein
MSSNDWKYFLLGILSSITAVVVWDIVKYEKKLLEFKNKDEIR